MTADDRLAEALEAEHAAVFGYGALGAYLDAASTDLAVTAEAAHRDHRDETALLLADRDGTPPAAEPVYELPFMITDQDSALELAATIEERTAAVWYRVLAEASGDDRELAARALTDCAVFATRAKVAGGMTPTTVALPGAPA